ncbi:MAG: putative lipid II flippase FtsW [Negativicutes bacterium]|nr:putative lipid II flippase FtsW [Negativicutes bacterium]
MKMPWSSPAEAIIYISLTLAVFGMVNVFSASFVMAGKQLGDSLFFIKRHILYFFIGVVGFVSLVRLDYRKLRPLAAPAALVTLALLFAVGVAGLEANGARRWLSFGGIVFQPSEVAKLTAIFVTAAFLGTRIDRKLPHTLLSWPLVFVGGMGFLIFRQPDMGTALVVVGLAVLLYLLAGIPGKERLILFMLGSISIGYLAKNAAYRAERIMAWLDPWSYAQTAGYQAVQALLAIGSGGLAGSGLGMGASKFHYLPEAHTDFAFAVLAQEMGFMGVLAVIVLFTMLGWYGLKIALKAADGFGQMLAAGTTALIVGQGIGNMAMVSGLLPVTGVPLPFISYGGTSLIVNMLALGMLLSVSRQAHKTVRQPAEKVSGPAARIQERAKLRLVKNNKNE